MYRIRFHGRGGQGIKTAAQVLGSAFFGAGFEVQDAPRYGAERRGAPIVAYVRADRRPIQERGVIARPDLVAVADDTLIAVPAAGILEGLSERTVVLLATTQPAAVWRNRLKLVSPIIVVPTRDLDTVGVCLAAGAAQLVGGFDWSIVAAALDAEIVKFGESARARSLAAAQETFEALAASTGIVQEGAPLAAQGFQRPDWIDVPRDSGDQAMPVISRPASSERVQTGAWRTMRPVIDAARCRRCAWVCSTLCPDSAIRVAADHTPTIDYDHCKGCLVCVAVCPPHAIDAVPESSSVHPEAAP